MDTVNAVVMFVASIAVSALSGRGYAYIPTATWSSVCVCVTLNSSVTLFSLFSMRKRIACILYVPHRRVGVSRRRGVCVCTIYIVLLPWRLGDGGYCAVVCARDGSFCCVAF